MRLFLQHFRNNGQKITKSYERRQKSNFGVYRKFALGHASRESTKIFLVAPKMFVFPRFGFASKSFRPGSLPTNDPKGNGNNVKKVWLGSATAAALAVAFYAYWKSNIGDLSEQIPTANDGAEVDLKDNEGMQTENSENDNQLTRNKFDARSNQSEVDAVSINLEIKEIDQSHQSEAIQDNHSVTESEVQVVTEDTNKEHHVDNHNTHIGDLLSEKEDPLYNKILNDGKNDGFNDASETVGEGEIPSMPAQVEIPVKSSEDTENQIDNSEHASVETAINEAGSRQENAEINVTFDVHVPKQDGQSSNEFQDGPAKHQIQNSSTADKVPTQHDAQQVLKVSDNKRSGSASEQKEVVRDRTTQAGIIDHTEVSVRIVDAIRAAEKRQAEEDAKVYGEYKEKLKEKYEKELRDARARELMYAEEIDSLEKELNKEKEKAAAAMKALLEKAEERLKLEIKLKEDEAERKLNKAHSLAEAEKAAAIAKEISTHLNEIANANIQINALRMAFFARSKEARQSHSLHKVSLGIFALEDAIMNGKPLNKEMEILRASMKDVDKDDLLGAVLSAMPSDVLTHGTKTKAQLHQKFESLKGPLRELALIPSNGGGLLTHVVARFASLIKVKESGLYSDGIESTIARVENLLATENLIEAANVLEIGAQGSKAEGLASEWATQARIRAVVEQSLALLQAHAITIASSLV